MAQLTQEHFDQTLKGLATKKDLESLATKADLERSATKQDLTDLEERLNLKLDAIHQMLDVRYRVEKLEETVAELKLQLRHQH
jgi:hypothetical protein